jgi:hypothetical protein
MAAAAAAANMLLRNNECCCMASVTSLTFGASKFWSALSSAAMTATSSTV